MTRDLVPARQLSRVGVLILKLLNTQTEELVRVYRLFRPCTLCHISE
jgi:hypothetical protein